jgi:hypothetical protein
MAASLMAQGRIQAVIVGADRIAANGDTANKIGTYNVAILAREHGIPFYVAAPWSTIDLATADRRPPSPSKSAPPSKSPTTAASSSPPTASASQSRLRRNPGQICNRHHHRTRRPPRKWNRPYTAKRCAHCTQPVE